MIDSSDGIMDFNVKTNACHIPEILAVGLHQECPELPNHEPPVSANTFNSLNIMYAMNIKPVLRIILLKSHELFIRKIGVFQTFCLIEFIKLKAEVFRIGNPCEQWCRRVYLFPVKNYFHPCVMSFLYTRVRYGKGISMPS